MPTDRNWSYPSLAPADLQCMNPNAVLLIAVSAKLFIIQIDGVCQANAPRPRVSEASNLTICPFR